MWDSASKLNAIPKKIMRRAHGFIIMIDLTDHNWEASVREFCNKLNEENRSDAIKILVANKMDLENERAFT